MLKGPSIFVISSLIFFYYILLAFQPLSYLFLLLHLLRPISITDGNENWTTKLIPSHLTHGMTLPVQLSCIKTLYRTLGPKQGCFDLYRVIEEGLPMPSVRNFKYMMSDFKIITALKIELRKVWRGFYIACGDFCIVNSTLIFFMVD